MKLIKLVTLIILIIISWVGYSQDNVRIKLKINLIPVEDRNGHLKDCNIRILRNNIELQSYSLSNSKIKKTISTRGIYKFEFSKKSYVSKHVIIDAVDIPPKRKKYHLKADITLFHFSDEDNVDFLKKEPISIAYYDYVNKEMRWDFEYYRGVVEKIIKAQISK
jgi:hypothetical protein